MEMLSRPIFSLWPYLWRGLLHFAVFAVLAIFGTFFFLINPACAAVLLRGRRSRWVWRFTRQVRRFQTARAGRIILHYAPELNDKWHLPTLLQRCQVELGRLTNRFGFPLRGRAVVFLFASCRDIGAIFGPPYGGAALSLANAIVIGNDNNIQRSMRHEFVHLFSAHWSRYAPPLLSEGLSVWLEESVWLPEESMWRQAIDEEARALLRNRSPKIPLLVEREFFFAEPHRHACYVLAGSFTGFLLRRYGWQQYRQLFCLCNGIGFPAKFETCFGVSLEKAEWQWRNEIMITEILKTRLRKGIRS
jgi:hypothetical protein